MFDLRNHYTRNISNNHEWIIVNIVFLSVIYDNYHATKCPQVNGDNTVHTERGIVRTTLELGSWLCSALQMVRIAHHLYLKYTCHSMWIQSCLLAYLNYYALRQQWTSKDWWHIYRPDMLQYLITRENWFGTVPHDCLIALWKNQNERLP